MRDNDCVLRYTVECSASPSHNVKNKIYKKPILFVLMGVKLCFHCKNRRQFKSSGTGFC